MKILDGAEFHHLQGGLSEYVLVLVLALQLVEIIT